MEVSEGKKVNKAKKGYTKEKRCRDELKADGWKILAKSIRWRFGTWDFAGLFDVVAVKGKAWKFISCKHLGKGNYYLSHQIDISRFQEEHGLEGMSFELWLWDAPRWKGRGVKKVYNIGQWKKIEGIL